MPRVARGNQCQSRNEALRRVGRFTEETALVDLFVAQEPSRSVVRADPAEVMDWSWVSLSEVNARRRAV